MKGKGRLLVKLEVAHRARHLCAWHRWIRSRTMVLPLRHNFTPGRRGVCLFHHSGSSSLMRPILETSPNPMADSSPGQELDASSLSQIREIIAGASEHNLVALQRFIDNYAFSECKAVDIQDPSTGYTPLHAAIASCAASTANGNTDATSQPSTDAAEDTVRLLLENGAIWNQLDQNDETPGCIANRLGLFTLYQLMVDAGVRAEMLLNRLDQYDELADEDDHAMSEQEPPEPDVQAGRPDIVVSEGATEPDVNAAAYLSSTLSMSNSKILDEQQNGVMMAWEKDVMSKSADALLSSSGLRVLNIGFGMGIIDTLIQSHAKRPAEHHIIEAHSDVLNDMKAKGWFDKSGVIIHEGRWQDVLPTMVSDGLVFDAIYYDTFAETYKDFTDFFSEHVLGLLDQSGKWSFFNGMGADRQISYDVYQKIVEMDLFEAGFDVEWTDVDLPDLGRQWEGVRRKYWNVEKYRLPVCKFLD
jgi:type IV protein arginine methyltransferase